LSIVAQSTLVEPLDDVAVVAAAPPARPVREQVGVARSTDH